MEVMDMAGTIHFRLTYLQVRQPVLTLGLLFLDRLTLTWLDASSEGATSFGRRRIGSF